MYLDQSTIVHVTPSFSPFRHRPLPTRISHPPPGHPCHETTALNRYTRAQDSILHTLHPRRLRQFRLDLPDTHSDDSPLSAFRSLPGMRFCLFSDSVAPNHWYLFLRHIKAPKKVASQLGYRQRKPVRLNICQFFRSSLSMHKLTRFSTIGATR